MSQTDQYQQTIFHLRKLKENPLKQEEAGIIRLPRMGDRRGNLSVIEEEGNVPFKICRTYWIYDVPGGEVREGHAFRMNQEFIVALSGSFDVIIDNGVKRDVYSLNRSYYGLYVPCLMWRQMQNFSTNALALMLASTPYDPGDYICDYNQFREMIRQLQNGHPSFTNPNHPSHEKDKHI